MSGQVKRMAFFLFAALLAALLWPASAVRAETAAGETDAGETDAGKTDSESRMILTAAGADTRETVDLTVGRELFYGTYSTNYFDVNGRTAYCLEPLKDTPASGNYEVRPLEDGLLRKGLYYVYGGPGYGTYVQKFGRLGAGGSRTADEEYCMSHCILSYLYSGSPDAFTGLTDSTVLLLKEQIGNIRSLPDPPESFYAFLFNIGGDSQAMGGSGKDRTGSLEIYKKTDQPEWTARNSCYSLAGAVFGVYRPGEDSPAWKITTDSNGYGSLNDIPIGTYELAEIESPEGFALSAQRRQIRVEDNSVCQYEWINAAQNYPAGLLLSKMDAGTGSADAQGAASLEGAEFTVKYYKGHYDSDPALLGINPEKTWVLRTNEEGRLFMAEEQKISGDDFYRNSAGDPVLPLGTLTFQETKAPEGYLLNEEVFTEKITAEGSGETDTVFHAPAVSEDVIRGDLQIVKFRENPEEELKTAMEGILFTITSRTTGQEYEIVTDQNGYASTKQLSDGRGALPYDTYTVKEMNAPAGLKPAGEFEITIREEGRTLYYILENKTIFSPVRLVKKDRSTGEVIPLAGAQFRLLDENKEEITMSAYYPEETVYHVFETDESGSFLLPEKLPAGRYYFQEVRAPEGYLLNKDLIPFTVDREHDWQEPFTVECQNEPARGILRIRKTDENTGERIPGVKFEIRAKEDILTPQGNIRVQKGSVVEVMETGEDGTAASGHLYLGKYEVRETSQAPGYILSGEIYDVELKYAGQEEEIVTEELEIKNHPTTVIIFKTESGTGTPLAGVEFTVWKQGESEEEGTACVTDESGRIVLDYLLPGSYCLKETKSLPGYPRRTDILEFTVAQDGTADGMEELVISVENDRTKIRDTRAVWKESGLKEIRSGGQKILVDTVTLEHLDPEKEYRLAGLLADKETGDVLLQNGLPVSGERIFTEKEAAEGIRIEFPVDTGQYPGREIVVLEYLWEDGILISSHEDLNDPDQTAVILGNPRTGDDLSAGKICIFAALAALAAAAALWAVKICTAKYRKKRFGRRE